MTAGGVDVKGDDTHVRTVDNVLVGLELGGSGRRVVVRKAYR